jgi:hypothetical protein
MIVHEPSQYESWTEVKLECSSEDNQPGQMQLVAIGSRINDRACGVQFGAKEAGLGVCYSDYQTPSPLCPVQLPFSTPFNFTDMVYVYSMRIQGGEAQCRILVAY